MSDIFKKQKDFMVACEQFVNKQPGFNYETRLWTKLIDEEHKELIEAYQHFYSTHSANDLANVAKETIDLIYVLAGLLNNLGIDGDEIFDAVHESNMAKVDPATGHVIKRDDGKVLKPDGWQKPDILALVLKRQHIGGTDNGQA